MTWGRCRYPKLSSPLSWCEDGPVLTQKATASPLCWSVPLPTRCPDLLLHLSLSPLSEVAADLMLLLMTFRRGNDMLAMYCKHLSLL